MISNQGEFGYIIEYEDKFLNLFSHRYDFLYSRHVAPFQSAEWRTESEYPLSDRQIRAGKYLYGVRHKSTATYALLDIDRGSPYHPASDPMAIGRMAASLEKLGLVSYIAVSSSYSGGIHLYFPFDPDDTPIASWQLAIAVKTCLESSGFLVQDGILEVFPNIKNFDPDGKTLFKGHRLPLQAGSYLLDKNFNLCHSSTEIFYQQWTWATTRSQLDRSAIDRAIRKSGVRLKKLTFKAQKFLSDLNTEILDGWTGFGQSNQLLGRIAMRAYIFGHHIEGGKPLTGDRLINEIARTAQELPGYVEFCRHQHEIYQRAEEWGRCVESSKYYPYLEGRAKIDPVEPCDLVELQTYNKLTEAITRDRLHFAIADLLNRDSLPFGITDRAQCLSDLYGFSFQTLYRHADLWHPIALADDDDDDDSAENFIFSENALSLNDFSSDRALGASSEKIETSLLSLTDRKRLLDKGKRAFWEGQNLDIGCNPSSVEGFSDRTFDKGGGSG